jgi:L-ascorbate metabolism protein UlaG (beta-lactamase superfamily)
MRLRLIRHATLIVEYGGQTFLVDPMLDHHGVRPPIKNSPNPRNNPLVPLPFPAEEVGRGVDALLVTHTHSDHWDTNASLLLNKQLPLLCQPEDEAKFRGQGFAELRPVLDETHIHEVRINRTGCQHGRGEIGKRMAPASGYVLRTGGEPTLYLAGDTIWCPEVSDALSRYEPAIVVLNTGSAQFLEGDPITMTADDVVNSCQAAPGATVVAVHMETINHCLLTRADLAFQLEAARVNDRVSIPNDGDWVDMRV